MKFGLSQPMRRVEDPRLLRGGGRYTDDISLPGQAFGVVVRSPHAHAAITGIDKAPALAVPGVLAVFTGADLRAMGLGDVPCAIPLKNRDGSDRAETPRPALAVGRVRHVGDPVAFVVAESPQAAKDGAEALAVDYDVLPSATDLATALDAGQPQLWDSAKGNLCFDWETGSKAETDRLFAEAAHVSRLTVVNNRVVVASMEGRGAVAEYDRESGRFTLHTCTQGSWLVRRLMATEVFKLPEELFRVITPDVGGGFGMKLYLYPEHVMVTVAARELGRPVKWTSDRSEAFLSDTHGRDNITTGLEGTRLRLRVPRDPRERARGADEHRAGRRLSRRGAAGGELPGRAADRQRGARARHRPRGTPPAQHRAAHRDAVEDADGRDL